MFYERLRAYRTSAGLTQKQVVDYLGITERAYQNYEYGNREPNIKTILKLAKVLNISVGELIGEVK